MFIYHKAFLLCFEDTFNNPHILLMMIKPIRILFFLAGLIGFALVYSVDNISHATDLFDSKRGVVEQGKKQIKAKPVKPKMSKVSYKLMAISKISDKYNLTFQNIRKKNKVHHKWNKKKQLKESPIAGLYVFDVVNRSVLFKPVDEKSYSCSESKIERVTCDPKNKTIIYELVTNKPVKASVAKNKNPAKKKTNTKTKKVTNPASKQAFKPKRIEKSEVPDDMRLIKTPFGDRLVPK